MPIVLAVDPGRDKTGYAVVQETGAVLEYGILPTKTLVDELEALCQKHPTWQFAAVVCGDGTHHKAVAQALAPWAEQHGWSLQLQNERNSTVEGRARYWTVYPPTGWRKWVPTSWLTPPRAVDDLTAWVIGERYWKERSAD